MAFPRNSLRAFLQYARNNLTSALRGDRKVNIVIGNESADLDSLTSSLLFAYLKSSSPPTDAFSPVYIPILNIASSRIRLRPEFSNVCEHAGISTSNLLNLDDLRPGFKEPDNTRWILMDHNRLQGSLGGQYSQYVRGVIDHHDEENAVPSVTGPEPRIIERAGSCTSLVIRHCRLSWDALSDMSLSSGAGHAQGEFAVNDSAFTRGWDAQLAKLALASILIDTANLTAPGKVEEADRQSVRYLEAKIGMSAKDVKTWSRENFYGAIDDAKRNIEPLTLPEILIKDYKEWIENGNKLGISSVVKPLAFLVEKASHDEPDSFGRAVDAFMADRDLSVFAIMTSFKSANGDFQRELLVQASGPSITNFKLFSGTATSELQLENLELGVPRQASPASGQVWRKFWIQRDITKSRKQVAPMLREALKG